jgi:RES domain-containing protein
MPAIQPIPRNTPSSADRQAADVLALHNRSTDGRQRTPARWNPPTQRSTATGENSGRRVK